MKKETIIYFVIGIVILLLAITFYFKTNTYRVIFAVDGAAYETKEVRKNTSFSSLPKPEKEGYAFIGWYDEDGNLLETSTIILKDTVYYARWAEIVTEEENH